jgi:RNA polymerase sigma-70 factor (ECF subfamily)
MMNVEGRTKALPPVSGDTAKGYGPLTALSDEQLVAEVRAGNQQAVEELVGRYQHKAYAIAFHMCSEVREEAEDNTQEAFLRAFRGLDRFRGDSSFYTWFYRIVVNLCRDRKRHWWRWNRLFVPWQKEPGRRGDLEDLAADEKTTGREGDPADRLRYRQLSEDIRNSLSALPRKQRLAFQLKVLHGMSIKEIAQVMGTAEGTVKSHLFRATQFLREALKAWEQP